jgi:ribose transport system ATP-binding protein
VPDVVHLDLPADVVTNLLQIHRMSKSFSGTRVLHAVDLGILTGEVHALVGANGSGKSTLIKILAGYHTPEPETVVEAGGERVPLGHPTAAREAGLRFVHQDLALVDNLTVTENLALGRGFTTGAGRRILWGVERRKATAMVRSLGFDFDVRSKVGDLAAAQRTGVAIARALWDWEAGARVLVLDEPTAALPKAEVDILFAAIGRVRDRGLGVLYVSHRLDEVFSIAHRVTVLRDGRRVGTFDTPELTEERLIEMMVGVTPDQEWKQLADRTEERADLVDRTEERLGSLMVGEAGSKADKTRSRAAAETLLKVRGLRGDVLRGIDFDAGAGEVLGFAGLTGSGRDELLPLLFGAVPRSGSVAVAGNEVPAGDLRAAIKHGISLVPADRHRQGLTLGMTVRENCTLTSLRPFLGPLGAILRRRELAEVREWIARLDLRPPDPNRVASSLSGGNQQKVVLSKWLRMRPRILLLDEPTHGVDVGAKAMIHELIVQAARAGAAAVIASSDDEELAAICDRVLVLRDGQVAAELKHEQVTLDALGRLALSSTRSLEDSVDA